ncbi:hypothetical protein [Streptomyces prunicolor]|uniref:Uncharacterized protein n=1 Tax=Streptomyces prunicolor TaxID=67348 RepID=A0ABU4F7E0_9ACTN|nr:hypothetical protein [Streptomyces prunicolor]MDV7216513.1 hypothetical protein [Streptomyces prunicolor]
MNSRIPPGPPNGPLQPPGHGDSTRSEPRPARPHWKTLTHAGAALGGLFVGVPIGVTSNSSTNKTAPSAAVTMTAITIREATDKAFTTTGCKAWKKIS